ncbi:MAG: hypothetical protein H0W88_04675 [Parachlamydiaceae bacterium]|nr:hypothetical protein [Parachlamydiaceae bacterium]
MKNIVLITLGLLCLIGVIHADDAIDSEIENVFSSSLANMETLIPNLVNNSVSVITGELSFNETDFVIEGPEKLFLNRTYSSQHVPYNYKSEIGKINAISDFNVGHSWFFNLPNILYLEKSSKDEKKTITAYMSQASGAKTIHVSKVSKQRYEEERIPLKVKKKKGLTNCLSSNISARTNLNNIILFFDHARQCCTSISGNGSIIHYAWDKKSDCYNKPLIPLFEKKPNGNHYLYKNTKISTSNKFMREDLSWLQYQVDKEDLNIETSDGKKGSYRFICEDTEVLLDPQANHTTRDIIKKYASKKEYRLSEANFSHKPFVKYTYNKHQLLNQKEGPEGRFLKISYYKQGSNNVDKLSTVNTKSNSLILKRVKHLRAPFGVDGEPIITHRFVYHINELNPKNRLEYSGATDVFDALMRKTTYHYDSDHRLTSLEKYIGPDQKSYMTEVFIWQDEELNEPAKIPKRNISSLDANVQSTFFEDLSKSEKQPVPTINNKNNSKPLNDEYFKKIFIDYGNHLQIKKTGPSNLLGKYIQDSANQIQMVRLFKYSHRGNIVEDTLYGNLSGKKNDCVVNLDQNFQPTNNVEQYKRHYHYSDDQYNLLLSEVEDNKKEIEYVYYPNTNLLQSKLLKNGSKICLREFYEYDDNAVQIKVIKDNGNSRDKDDFKGITERHIIYIQPRKALPIGLPEKIYEKYFDFNKGQEVLLKYVFNDYSKQGHLIKQDHYNSQEQYCYSLEWDYDNHGNLKREKNALNHNIYREYDNNDNLIKEIRPNQGYQTIFTYDCSNHLMKVSEVHEDGNIFNTNYQYDHVGNRLASKDHFGRTTQYKYDDLNRLIETIYPEVMTDHGVQTPRTSICYDIFNNPITITDSKNNNTIHTYNLYGKPTSVTNPDRTHESFEYYLDGTLAKSISCDGTITNYQRDCFGRVLKEQTQNSTISYTYYGSKLKSKIDAEGCNTNYHYDGAGRLIKTDCQDRVEILEYDNLSRISKKKQYFGINNSNVRVEAFEYDNLNRINEERIEDGHGGVLRKVKYKYDSHGNRESIKECTKAGKSEIITKYNSQNLPIEVIDQQSNSTHISYDNNFNGKNTLAITTTDPVGNTSIQIFDSHDRLSKTICKNAFGILLSEQEIFYDIVGNKTQVIDLIIVGGKRKQKIMTKWNYNSVGQETIQIDAFGTPDQKQSLISYNEFGQKDEIQKPDGTSLLFEYDSFGRLKNLQSSDSTISYSYKYDKNHQIVSVVDLIKRQETIRKYDSFGNLVFEKLGNDHQISYEFDQLNRVNKITLPDRSEIQYTYDSANLKEVARLINGEKKYSHHYQKYDQSGNLTHSKGLSHKTEFKYDLSKRKVQINTPSWKQSVPQNGYDSLGRLTTFDIEDKIGKTHYEFSYSDLNDLLSERGHVTHTYGVDSIHNRISKNTHKYSINSLNQLFKQGSIEYKYNLNGNLVEKINGSKKIQYFYDALNRLTGVKKEGVLTEYQYDAFNRRLSKKKEGLEKNYLYLDQDEIGEIDSKGKIQQLRILGLGIDAEIGSAVALELNGQVYEPIHDHNGNVVCLAQNGKAIETYRYTAFGEGEIYDDQGKLIDKSQCDNPWRYASKRFDDETGLIFFGRRYYDPEIGRWITPDPLGYSDGPNLYAYLHHNPLTYHDAYGLYGRAYADSCHAGMNSPHFCDWDRGRSNDLGSNDSSLWDNYCYYSDKWTNFHTNISNCWLDGMMSPFSTLNNLNNRLSHLQYVWNIGFAEAGAASYVLTECCEGASETLGLAMCLGGLVQLGKSAAVGAYQGLKYSCAKVGISSIVNRGLNCSSFQAAEFNSGRVFNCAGRGIKNNSDFIASTNGIVIPKSRSILESGFQRAGFQTFQTESRGMGYILPNGNVVRVMENAGKAPLRASFTNRNGGPINIFTGKPPQPGKGMNNLSRREYVRENTHLDLMP